MRTTLDIDDDVLAAAKELAKARDSTAGRVISDLARQALTEQTAREPQYRGGFRLLPPTEKIVTSEMIQKWLDEDI
jgi:predicted transcriptional regulator